MGQLTMRHNLSPNPLRNPNSRRNPNLSPTSPPLTGKITILRRGDPPTAFLERESPPPLPPPQPSLLTAATCHVHRSSESNTKKTKKKKSKKKVGFRDCDDVELYSATCRLGPEPEMVPFPLSLLRKALL